MERVIDVFRLMKKLDCDSPTRRDSPDYKTDLDSTRLGIAFAARFCQSLTHVGSAGRFALPLLQRNRQSIRVYDGGLYGAKAAFWKALLRCPRLAKLHLGDLSTQAMTDVLALLTVKNLPEVCCFASCIVFR